MVDSSKQNITWWEITAMQAINLEDIDRPDFVALYQFCMKMRRLN
ncbi:hypothetical protein SAMD00079811_22940 [Scytonema sp. HK-05]|nr:hypothetical protein [Scytonema sp. HK-05]BAY44693.1 hypothetical protein SAMD00079811_22940 [Scytonema sp. HK-05]